MLALFAFRLLLCITGRLNPPSLLSSILDYALPQSSSMDESSGPHLVVAFTFVQFWRTSSPETFPSVLFRGQRAVRLTFQLTWLKVALVSGVAVGKSHYVPQGFGPEQLSGIALCSPPAWISNLWEGLRVVVKPWNHPDGEMTRSSWLLSVS